MRDLSRHPVTHEEIAAYLERLATKVAASEPVPGSMEALLLRTAARIVREDARRAEPVRLTPFGESPGPDDDRP